MSYTILIPAQHLLLNYVAELPELHCLRITIADSNATRGYTCGNPAMRREDRIRGQIRDHLMAFVPADPVIHFPDITTTGQVYEIVKNQEGEFCLQGREEE